MPTRTKRIFISYDYTKDRPLKGSFVGEAKRRGLPIRLQDFSLEEDHRDPNWEKKAKDRIRRCDLVIVLIGEDTQNASGVRKEVDIARGLRKLIMQVRPRKWPYGKVRGAGELYPLKWRILDELLS